MRMRSLAGNAEPVSEINIRHLYLKDFSRTAQTHYRYLSYLIYFKDFSKTAQTHYRHLTY